MKRIHTTIAEAVQHETEVNRRLEDMQGRDIPALIARATTARINSFVDQVQ